MTRWLDPTTIPPPLRTVLFVLESLGPEHNERDHVAWMSSIEHIRSTPGFAPGDWGSDGWPIAMSLAQNLGDLDMHRGEFERGEAFAYSVLDPSGAEVVGCVYIDPDPSGQAEAAVRSWVTADARELDAIVATAVDAWLRDLWPIRSIRWPGRWS